MSVDMGRNVVYGCVPPKPLRGFPDGKMQNIYHYHLNNEFPYAIGCFRGEVNYDQALGSADLRAHNKPQGVPGKGHNHNHNQKSDKLPGIISIPIGAFQ